MEPMADFAQLHLHFVDHIQWRYEVLRPIVLLHDRTAAQRAEETHTHPETVRKLARRLQQQGRLGLLPPQTDIVRPSRGRHIPEAVVEEIARLKALYDGLRYREVARIIWHQLDYRIDDKTVKKLWLHSPGPVQGELPLGAYHSHAERPQARLQVLKLYYQGWSKRSISHFLQVARPTVDRWLGRFEAEQMAGLADKSRAPKSTTRKAWLPLMLRIYHLHKRHPDAGECRLWSRLADDTLFVRTVGRVMAITRQVYDDIPHVRRHRPKKPPPPHPYKATAPHQFWFSDGRQLDFALDGVKWWSLIMLDGDSRTMLAGALAPTEASWAALTVLYTACLRYGVPQVLMADRGGAYSSSDFEAVCDRLTITHKTIISSEGPSYLNFMETHFNIQRRLYDYQFALSTTPAALEQVHQTCMHVYNTTAHQG